MIYSLTFIFLLILPGYLLSALLFPKISWFQRLPLAFSFSLALLGLPAVLLLNLHTPPSYLAWFTLLTNLTLGTALFLKINQSTQSTNQLNQLINPITQLPNYLITNFQLIIPTLLAAAFALYLFISTAAIRDFGDHWFYLNFIRQYLDSHLDPALNPLIGQEVTPGTLNRAATNGWWVLIALVVKVSGQPLLEAYWLILPPILMVISLFAFSTLARELFENHKAALTAVLLQLILYLTSITSHDWIGQGFFTRIAEDKYLVWLVLLPISLSLLIRYIKTNEWRHLIALIVSLAAIAVTHPFGLLQFAYAVACFAIAYLPFNWRRISLLKAAVFLTPLLFFLIIPILQQLFPSALTLTQFIPAEIQTPPNDTHLMILSAPARRYLLHPHLIFHPLTLLAVLLSPLLLPKIKHSITAQFLLPTTLLPIILLYNPITAPIFGRFLSPLLLWRITWILPPTLLLAYLLNNLTRYFSSRFSNAKSQLARLTPLAIILIFTFPFFPYITNSIDFLEDYKTRIVTNDEQALLKYLCETDTIEGNLIADPRINTLIPSCRPSIQLLTYRIFQSRPTAAEEIESFYQNRLISQSAAAFLTRWQASYLIVPTQTRIAGQIALLPDIFIIQYSNASYSLYEVSLADHPIISGNEAFIRGDLLSAESLYKQAQANPALSQFGLGQVWFAQGETTKAENAFLEAIAAEPTFTAPYLALTDLYRQNGRPAAAQFLLLEALRHNPTSHTLHETLGDLYLELNDATAAEEQFQQAIPPFPNPNDALLALANLYHAKGLPSQALATFEAVIQNEKEITRSTKGLINFRPGWSQSWTFDRRAERLAAAHQAVATLYEQQQNTQSAENAYRALINLQPTRESSFLSLASYLRRSNRQNEIVSLYENAVRTNFHLSWPYRRLAETYQIQYQADESQTELLAQARTTLQRAMQIEPDNIETHQLLVQNYELLKQPEEAVAVYQQAAEKYTWLAWPLINLAQYHLESGNFAAAETALTKAIERQPADQTAYNLLAETHLNRGDTAAAIQTYQLAVANNAYRAWPYLGRGNAYLAARLDDLAIASLLDGLSREPDNAAVYATLGSIYRWNVGDPETAVTYFFQSLQRNPNQPDTLMGLAATLISLGRIDDGLPYLENALALAPESSSNFQQAGDIMWQLGRVDEAKAYYLQSLEQDRQNAFAHLGLAHIYHQQGDYESAIELATLAVRFSNSPHATGPAQMQQAQCYLALGRPEEALPHILAAIDALPADPWYQATAGDYYHYQQNDPAQAVPYYRQAAELAPQQPILQAALGTALYDAGQVDEALPYMEQAVSLAGTDPAVFLRIGSVLNKYADWERLIAFYETAVANGIENPDINAQLANAYSALEQ